MIEEMLVALFPFIVLFLVLFICAVASPSAFSLREIGVEVEYTEKEKNEQRKYYERVHKIEQHRDLLLSEGVTEEQIAIAFDSLEKMELSYDEWSELLFPYETLMPDGIKHRIRSQMARLIGEGKLD